MNYLLFHDIYMSMGNTFKLDEMLNECIPNIVNKLNCFSSVLYKKNADNYELLYVTENIVETREYEHILNKVKEQFKEKSSVLIIEKIGDIYYYFFELDEFGYLVLTKCNDPLEANILDLIKHMNLKLLHAIKSCEKHGLVQKLENELQINTNLINTIINTVPLRIFWKNRSSIYLGANKLFLKDAKCNSVDTLIGKSDHQLSWSTDDANYYSNEDQKVMNSGIAKLDHEEFYTDEKGNKRWVTTSLVPLKNLNGEVTGILGTYYDITQKKENEDKLKFHRDALEYQATHDALTQLPNRLLFIDRLEHSLYLAQGKNTKVAVLFVDIDNFKNINDSFGHTFGDSVIKEVGERIKDSIRIIDTVARFGGDEFVIFLDNISEIMIVTEILGKIIKTLQVPLIIHNHTLYVTVSIGVTIYPHDAKNAHDLIINSDMAMYKAKGMGRNNYQFYTEDMTQKSLARMKLESSLHKAIKNKDFLLYYQPKFKVDTQTAEFIGMEALIRWKDENNQFISPDVFIPLAEETGLIIPLGKWIMKEGMEQIALWYKRGLNPGRLALNFSMLQLQNNDFISYFQSLLLETGCKHEWLEIEITESQMMKNPDKTIVLLNLFHTLGIKIAIDDFGTGYSSLSYLKRLPLDIIKIDKSFIKNIPSDEEDLAIVKGILALSKSLNLTVIAEGVETIAQKEVLVEHGCHFIQGYYYDKALSAKDIEKHL